LDSWCNTSYGAAPEIQVGKIHRPAGRRNDTAGRLLLGDARRARGGRVFDPAGWFGSPYSFSINFKTSLEFNSRVFGFIIRLPFDDEWSTTFTSHLDMFCGFIDRAIEQVREPLHVRVFGVDPECRFRLQRLIDLFRVSSNAFKLTRLGVAHYQMLDADEIGGHGFQELAQMLVDELAHLFARFFLAKRGRPLDASRLARAWPSASIVSLFTYMEISLFQFLVAGDSKISSLLPFPETEKIVHAQKAQEPRWQA
jgi:hypothetical protein